MSSISEPAQQPHNLHNPNTITHNISHLDQNIPTISEPTTATEPTTSASHPVIPSAEFPMESSTGGTASAHMNGIAKQQLPRGTLGYKAPGVLNAFRFSKKFFWFGDEPVSHEHLDNYLRGEKAEVAHPTAAWSSQTGKGLLYFSKRADQNATPHGILNLSEVSDIRKDGPVSFVLSLHGQKHAFQTANVEERDEWASAIETEVEKAKAAKDEIVGRAGYKDTMSHIGRPTALAAGSRATSMSRKSTDLANTGRVAGDNASSSSSYSSEAGRKTKKSRTPTSRSVSRGKRLSIFGTMMGKKEEFDERKPHSKVVSVEHDVENRADGERPFHAGSAAPLNATAVAARVLSAPTETTSGVGSGSSSAAEPFGTFVAPVHATTTSKSAKRTSVFGNFMNKITTPTTEKKEYEVAPVVPPKDSEITALPTAGATSAEPIFALPTEASANVPPVTGAYPSTDAAPITPHKEREGFFGRLMNKEKAKVPNSDSSFNPSSTHGHATTGTIASENVATPTLGQIITPEHTTAAHTKEKRRGSSIFGNLSGSIKKPGRADTVSDGENGIGEESRAKKGSLGEMFRKPSKIIKSQKEVKKETSTPAAVTEGTAPTTSHNGVPSHFGTDGAIGTNDTSASREANTTNRNATGDVFPDAAIVGQSESRTPAVHASA